VDASKISEVAAAALNYTLNKQQNTRENAYLVYFKVHKPTEQVAYGTGC